MSWYYYPESKISFPFRARCVAAIGIRGFARGKPSRCCAWPVRMRASMTCRDPLAGRKMCRSSFSTGSHRCGRINPGGNRRLALLRCTGCILCDPDELLANKHTEHIMASRPPASTPTWTDVKAELERFDRPGLLALIQDLFAADKDNQTFLHASFGLGEDVLKPYKETLDRWLWPDVLRNQDTSVVKAKQAISSYKKAVGDPVGLAELMEFTANALRDSSATSVSR
jgi:hypothetical protein